MAYDHSRIYKNFKLRHLPHILRMRTIDKCVTQMGVAAGGSYADFGCSNGFLTERISQLVKATSSTGYDHLEDHFEEGRLNYPDVQFRLLDLNAYAKTGLFDFVTCFETFEHVGDLNQAVRNVIEAVKPAGRGLVAVPIEVGPRGVIKFLVKTLLYRYSLDELNTEKGFYARYVGALLTGARTSVFRQPPRTHWGTHFGFDYRDVDQVLNEMHVTYQAFNRGFNRFYQISR